VSRRRHLRGAALSLSQVLGLLLLSGAAVVAEGSSGSLDENGCHEGQKAGDYHCHEGPLAGRTFSSKDEAERRLQGKGAKAQEEPPRETLEEIKAQSKPSPRPARRPAQKRAPRAPDGPRRAP
jgi:hypothetical protein